MGRRLALAIAGVVAATSVWAAGANAVVPLTQLSTDPFTNTSSQHRTEVEPDTFAFGSTIVATSQAGRFFSGGSSDNGWMTSTNGGASWSHGFLPGITKYQGAGRFDRASDPSVAYDARHGVWLISSLALLESPNVHGAAVVVSRSADGIVWGNPIVVATGAFVDKNWIVCDNHPTSAFYGRCYSEWDDANRGDLILMSTSVDGGLTWGAARTTNDSATGLGGQPVVQPNGTVIVPYGDPSLSSIRSFRSVDGGASWRISVLVSSIREHNVAGGLRTPPLPSAEIDAAGKVYVAWQDCRFRFNCTSNDIVISTTTQSTYPTWSSPARVPIDAVSSTVDHFIPGIAVDPGTFGSTAHVALAYYYYPSAACTSATCQLNVGFVSSANGGATWSLPTQLAGPMAIGWLASTSSGRMVGDYISTSFSGGKAHPVFAVAKTPSLGLFDEAMYTPTSGL
jgi:hypothetical protein